MQNKRIRHVRTGVQMLRYGVPEHEGGMSSGCTNSTYVLGCCVCYAAPSKGPGTTSLSCKMSAKISPNTNNVGLDSVGCIRLRCKGDTAGIFFRVLERKILVRSCCNQHLDVLPVKSLRLQVSHCSHYPEKFSLGHYEP